MRLDHWFSFSLVPLALWTLLSGLDDLWITLVYLRLQCKDRGDPHPQGAPVPERPIAILVPLWQEHGVIGRMLDRNLSLVQYENFEVFAGVYPNDPRTRRAADEASRRHPRVHVIEGPHDGPTSKGDCLNWTYRGMEEHERRFGTRFQVVVIHDAEDLIHPRSLHTINRFSLDYEMVQVPVLPLPTGLFEITHGLYCDEFAEFQTKDIPVRQFLGGFLPGNGVGTGFERAALDRLAVCNGGGPFDPACLTEDYENGLRLHTLGCRQKFVALSFGSDDLTATREYFPGQFRRAVRQRSRWVAGIVLQGWQFHGWRAPRRQLYWFWRDRKGLIGNLLAPVANVFLLLGITISPPYAPAWVLDACRWDLLLAMTQSIMRAFCVARIYGVRFAMGVPFRLWWGNLVNFCATVSALSLFAKARLRGRHPAWKKTEHVYPSAACDSGRKRLGEVLVQLSRISTSDLEEALRNCPAGCRLGEHLIRNQKLSEENLYQALSIQAGLPLGPPRPAEINLNATRLLPAATVRRWKFLPYRISMGQLHLLTPEVPSDDVVSQLSRYVALEPQFRLVLPADFEQLASRYLPNQALHQEL